MRDKTKANRFIREHVRQYGLVGTNVTLNPTKGFTKVPTRDPSFTWGNHFVYGYNGNTFNCRDASTCMYFTDYLRPAICTEHIYEELERAAVEMEDQYGMFGIQINGLPTQYALADAARRAGVDFFQYVIQPDWSDGPYVPFDGRISTIVVKVENEALRELAPEVVGVTRSTNPKTLIRAYVSRYFENPLVFGGYLKFVNQHHDGINAVGPEHWCLVDEEEETAICRWMMYNGKRGCHNSTIWSPELIRAQLHPSMSFFAGEGGRSTDTWLDWYFSNLWETPIQLTRDVTEYETWWHEIQGWMKAEHDGGKHNEKCLTPLKALITRLGMHPPFLMNDVEDIYGERYGD